MSEVAKEQDVQVLGAEVNQYDLVFGQTLGSLENVDRLEPDVTDDPGLLRQLERPHGLKRGDDLAEVAMVAVVLMADDDKIGRLGDRPVSPRRPENSADRG
jgi:hypothetical protein